MSRNTLYALIILGVTGCSDKNDEVLSTAPTPDGVRQFVEKKAVQHFLQGLDDDSQSVRTQSEEKDGYWLVTVFEVPETPSAYVDYAVYEDGRVEYYNDMMIRREVMRRKTASGEAGVDDE